MGKRGKDQKLKSNVQRGDKTKYFEGEKGLDSRGWGRG